MLNVIAGQEVFDKIQAAKLAQVQPSKKVPGCFESESLCRFQSQMASSGYTEASIIKSIYGYGLRYASGLNDFAIIASSREIGDGKGTLKAAIEYAKKWQSYDPAKRYVTISDFELQQQAA